MGLLSSPHLVVRVNGKYYTWQVAAPLIMSAVVYLQAMPQKVQSKVTEKHMPKKVSTKPPLYSHLTRYGGGVESPVFLELLGAWPEGGAWGEGKV